MEDFIKIFVDPYDRKARLCPALLTLLAPAIAFMLVAPNLFDQFKIMAALAITFGVLMFLSSVGRDGGKRKEPGLFKGWGGIPTTQMLMYKSSPLDKLTLDRYRKTLESNISGLKFFDATQENLDQSGAAMVCNSAVKWLREATRDPKKFHLVLADNINYGFRRNLFGIRPLAISLCLLAFTSLEIYAWFVMDGYVTRLFDHFFIAESVLIIAVLMWGFVVTDSFVKTTAFSYATTLLSACDSPLLVK